MRYIIDLTIVFLPGERTLSLQNDAEQQVLLSNQGCRLLKEMVTSNHETLSRDELLRRVWGDYGFTQSNNSLNVAISEIRKALEVLGRDPQLITTVPKLGFCFRGIVQPETLDSPEQQSANNVISASISHRKNKTINVSKILTVLIAVIFISVIIFLTEGITKFHAAPINQKEENYTFLYDINHCKVFALGTLEVDNHQALVTMSKKDIAKEKIDCNLGRKDIFYTKIRETNTLTQITLIGICSRDKNGNYSNCLTIKNFYGAAQ